MACLFLITLYLFIFRFNPTAVLSGRSSSSIVCIYSAVSLSKTVPCVKLKRLKYSLFIRDPMFSLSSLLCEACLIKLAHEFHDPIIVVRPLSLQQLQAENKSRKNKLMFGYTRRLTGWSYISALRQRQHE